MAAENLNYETWAPTVKAKLVENGLWDIVETGLSPDPTKIPNLSATIKPQDLSQWRKRAVQDMKALEVIQSSLPHSTFKKTLPIAASSKALWDSLKNGNLTKKFENLTMYDYESMDSYLGRVTDLLDEFEDSGNRKPDYEVIVKLLDSLSFEFDNVRSVLEEFMELPDMTLKDLIETLDGYSDHPGEFMLQRLKKDYMSLKKAKAEQKWCGVCRKYSHNQVECWYKPTGVSEFRGFCFRCKEQGHRGRECSNASSDGVWSLTTRAEVEKILDEMPQHKMLAAIGLVGDDEDEVEYDEDMWMIYTTTSNHMTPYAKFFTAMDGDYRSRVELANGNKIMAEGKGDVKIVMNGVKKVIKDVLYVPSMDRNVLSVGQMTGRGYSVVMGPGGCTIREENGKVFATTTWEERGLALHLQVIEECGDTGVEEMMATHAHIDEKPKHQLLTATAGNFTYGEDIWMLYTASTDHMTPYAKFFTTLDRTYRAGIEMGNGSIMMAEGKGDVMIMVNGVKVTMTNVLFVPRINRNVLSYGKMATKGYTMEGNGGEWTIRSKTGKIFAQTRSDERGIPLRLQVIR